MDVQSPGIINCTGSSIRLYNQEKTKIVAILSKTEYVARLSLESTQKKVETHFQIGRKRVKVITSNEEGVFRDSVKGLPPKKQKLDDIVVSDAVGRELQWQGEKGIFSHPWDGNVYVPDFGNGAVTDKKGNIIGTTGFIQCHSKGMHAARQREELTRHREELEREREESNRSWSEWVSNCKANGTDPYR